MIKRHAVEFRKKTLVITDPQRRVYDGVMFSSEEVWTEWGQLVPFRSKEDAEESAASWRKINPKSQYRVTEIEVTEEQALAWGWKL